MKNSNQRVMTALLAAAALVGCAQPPAVELEAARKSMQAAREAQAEAYAPESWAKATDTDSKLQAEQAAAESRSSLLRSYEQTRLLAVELKDAADLAAADALAGKERTRNEATALMTQAGTKVDEAKKSLAAAPKGKGTHADLAALSSDVDGLDGSLRDAQAALDAGDFLGAKAKAKAAIEAADQVLLNVERARDARKTS